MGKRRLSGAALTAKAIKKRLSALYPNIKFSVRSDVFSMGDSVDIEWTDGPMQKAIEAITNQYQCGGFDGMQDLYTYREIDTSLDCPGAKYVHCNRNRSLELELKLEEKAVEYYADFDPGNYNLYHKRLIEIEEKFFHNLEVNDKSVLDEAIEASETESSDIILKDDPDTQLTNESKDNSIEKLTEEFKDPTAKLIEEFKDDPTAKLTDQSKSETIKEVNSTDNSVSILDKFSAVTIKETDFFLAEDMAFCKAAENIYKLAHALHTEFLEKALAFKNKPEILSSNEQYFTDYGYQSEYAGISHYKGNIINDNQTFISSICNHFSNKYKVTIEKPSWSAKIERSYRGDTEPRLDTVPLDYILKNIHEQMNGMTFAYKALHEVKEGMRSCVYNQYGNKWRFVIKGKKIIIDDFYYSYFDRIYKRYEIRINKEQIAFFKALTHFEYGEIYLNQKYKKFAEGYTIYENSGIYDKHKISGSSISSIKVFKNGKVEIEFNDSGKARLFAKEYCGYIEQQAM